MHCHWTPSGSASSTPLKRVFGDTHRSCNSAAVCAWSLRLSAHRPCRVRNLISVLRSRRVWSKPGGQYKWHSHEVVAYNIFSWCPLIPPCRVSSWSAEVRREDCAEGDIELSLGIMKLKYRKQFWLHGAAIVRSLFIVQHALDHFECLNSSQISSMIVLLADRWCRRDYVTEHTPAAVCFCLPCEFGNACRGGTVH